MDVQPTLSQTWTEEESSVRNMRSKCRCSYVLQFTFRHAVSCVLHRLPSQVIHCTVLFLQQTRLPEVVEEHKKSSRTLLLRGTQSSRLQKQSDIPPQGEEGTKQTRQQEARGPLSGYISHRTSWLQATGEHREPPGLTSTGHGVDQPQQASCSRAIRAAVTLDTYAYTERQPPRHERVVVVSESPSDRCLTAIPLMILPQVHLRKPCYDFYFL